MNRRLSTVALSSLNLPGDWKHRLSSERVRAMAASGDILQPPGIRAADRSLIFGGDRLAALHVRGETDVEVWLIDCTEAEAARMRIVENLHRRADNQDALKDQLVALELRLAAERATLVEPTGSVTSETNGADLLPDTDLHRRPKKSARGLAREAAAAAAGTTPEAIRSAEKREAARAKEAAQSIGAPQATAENAESPPSPPPAVPGLEVATALDEIDRHLKAALASITRLAKAHPEMTERFPLGTLKWTLRETAASLRACAPAAGCAYCKSWPTELPNCGACKGSGWLTKDQERDIPAELLVTGEAEGIFVGGEFVTLAELDRRQRGRKVVSKSSRGQEHAAAAGTIETPRALLKAPREFQEDGSPEPGEDAWPEQPGGYAPAPSPEDWSDAWGGDEK